MARQFIIHRETDEDIEIFLDDKEISSANHDTDGWSGMQLLEDTVRAIARELGIEVIET